MKQACGCTKQPCRCCAGIQIVTPEPEVNRPGLRAIAYRVGTYATFLESMVARLSNLYLEIPPASGSGVPDRIYPLKQLTTREAGDPSIALLDAWATVADVLTFYQERIANEGYLLTATERRSVLELARLVGYKLRPGVAASVYLAFTVINGFKGDIPAGTRAQSIPGTGETAQFFETSDKLAARDTWNNLKPRLTRPQVITPPNPAPPNPPLLVTGADVIDTVYLDGIGTNLKTGDGLLFVFGTDTGVGVRPAQQHLRLAEVVDPQADHKRTEVTLVQQPLMLDNDPLKNAEALLQLFIDKAQFLFPGSDIAGDIGTNILPTLISNLTQAPSPTVAVDLIRGAIARVLEKLDIAAKRGFTRIEAWTGHLLQTLRAQISAVHSAVTPSGGRGTLQFIPPTLKASPLANLGAIVGQLALAPSVQPANSLRMVRSVTQTFSPQSDIAPRLLAALKPAVASTLYQAWTSVETPQSRVEVQAARTKATLFASSYTGKVTIKKTVPDTNPKGRRTASQPPTPITTTDFIAPTIRTVWPALLGSTDKSVPTAVPLDATYDQIRPGSWAVIDRPVIDSKGSETGRYQSYHKVMSVKTSNMDTKTGYTAKVTLLTLDPAWLSDLDPDELTKILTDGTISPLILRGTVVYTQTEALDLIEEPLDTDVEGDTLDLDDVYDGIEAGRWIIVSGNRTDIPNVSGVTASELVMVSGVAQGSQAPGCVQFPSSVPPFIKYCYTTNANAFGDRLVVGELRGDFSFKQFGVPEFLNQQYCDQVQLAPGVYANAYVPTPEERRGNFQDFQGLLVDFGTGIPFKEGNIERAMEERKLFAWRVSSQKLHTILTLAQRLAYRYDTISVTIYGNVAKATHSQTVGEILGDGDGSLAFQSFTLHQSPLTYLSAPTAAGAESTLVTRVNEVEWHEVDDLEALGPRDRGYITRTNDADKASLVFGNGEHGARLPTGSANVKAVYRYGIGKNGNVKAAQISQLATHPLGAQGVINPLPASGGADRDSADQARRNTPMAVMALDRLVSVKDYADFARTYAGIGKASAVRISDGRRQVVHVTIAGADDIPIDRNSDLYRNPVTSLEQLGDPYLPIQVCVRKVKLLVMAAGVQVLPDYQWESVEPNIRAAMLDAFSFDGRDLGQSAFLSEAVSVMQGVQGVSYVDAQVFDSVAEDITVPQLAALAGTLTLNPYVRAELAHVNTSVDLSIISDPCKRILPAELVFLTPDIPDTLILTRIGNGA
jgi:hypothetical protein